MSTARAILGRGCASSLRSPSSAPQEEPQMELSANLWGIVAQLTDIRIKELEKIENENEKEQLRNENNKLRKRVEELEKYRAEEKGKMEEIEIENIRMQWKVKGLEKELEQCKTKLNETENELAVERDNPRPLHETQQMPFVDALVNAVQFRIPQMDRITVVREALSLRANNELIGSLADIVDRIVAPLQPQAEDDQETECCICYYEMCQHQPVSSCPNCIKRYHTQCINRWLCEHKTECPTCRQEWVPR